MAYTLPDDVDARPITIIGAGTLGRRIAAMYAAGGSEVRIVDPAEDQRASARDFVSANAEDIQRRLRLEADRVGAVETVSDLVEAGAGAWMVIEAVPERIDLKTEVFGDLDRLAEPDAILCSNSSSIPAREMIGKVERPERVLASDAALRRASREEAEVWEVGERTVLRGRLEATGLALPRV